MKKGQYPGGRKAGIFSEKVWNGGASNGEVRDLLSAQRRREQEEEDLRMMKRASKRSSKRSSGMHAGEGKRSVRRGNIVMYDREERRPVEQRTSVS